jgi:hypothetical protein
MSSLTKRRELLNMLHTLSAGSQNKNRVQKFVACGPKSFQKETLEQPCQPEVARFRTLDQSICAIQDPLPRTEALKRTRDHLEATELFKKPNRQSGGPEGCIALNTAQKTRGWRSWWQTFEI